MSIQISSSDTSLVQLYNAGIFNIPSGFANICEWEVTTFQGNIIHQDITSGEFSEQAFSLFNHSVPISDSMEVTLFITNMVEGITCSIVDTIYWEETEVLPGSFIGNWAVLGDYGGVENELLTSVEGIQDWEIQDSKLRVWPNPLSGAELNIRFPQEVQVESVVMVDAVGRISNSLSLISDSGTNKKFEFQQSEMAAGLYSLILTTKEGAVYSEKVVVE